MKKQFFSVVGVNCISVLLSTRTSTSTLSRLDLCVTLTLLWMVYAVGMRFWTILTKQLANETKKSFRMK